MPLTTEVGLGPIYVVLDGDPAPLPIKGDTAPNFRPMSLWPNGCWMDQDATWYEGMPRPKATLCYMGIQLPQKGHNWTHIADRAFRFTAPTAWNSLNSYTVDSGSLAVFKSRLKTFLFRRTFNPV